MKDNIPTITLDDYMKINALENLDVDEAKAIYNDAAMTDVHQANALLQLEIDRLKNCLEEKISELNALKYSCNDLKEENNELKKKMVEFNDLVNEHLKKVIARLNDNEVHNHTFVERVMNNHLLRKSIKKTEALKHEIEKC